MIRAGLLNFSKGILSERLLGRVDVAAYNAGVKQGENVIILKQGALTFRPGFELISDCLDEGERLLPFQFSNEQAYALALGQEYMQPLTGGGVVLEEELNIVDITNTNPMVLEVAFHGYEVGDDAFIDDVDGDLGDYLNRRVWRVVDVPDDSHFAIDVDGTALPAFTGSTGGVDNVAPPDPPPPAPPAPDPYVPPPEPPIYGNWKFYSGFGGVM